MLAPRLRTSGLGGEITKGLSTGTLPEEEVSHRLAGASSSVSADRGALRRRVPGIESRMDATACAASLFATAPIVVRERRRHDRPEGPSRTPGVAVPAIQRERFSP